MLDLAVQLTPPRPDTVEAQMERQEFLISDTTIERIKRKASLPDISPKAKRRLRFEPQAKDDITLAQYQEHVIQNCSRENLMVMIPADKMWPEMRNELTELRDQTCGLRTTVEELKARIKRLEVMNEPQLSLFKGNAVLDLAKLLNNKESLNREGSTTYLQQLAANATDKQLIKAGIPTKYWRMVRNLPEIITDRNKSAHESEIDFAKLLISEGTDTHSYQYWKDIFPVLYKDTVEQVAGRETPSKALARLELSDT